jgi:hypothetical protein
MGRRVGLDRRRSRFNFHLRFWTGSLGASYAFSRHPSLLGPVRADQAETVERWVMEIFEALVRTLKLYLVIGLVAAAVNALAFHAPPGGNQFERATVVAQDVVLWPRFLVQIAGAVDGRLATMPIEDQPFLYSVLRGGPYFNAADHP